jgi:hydroxyethylthiazole kinase
MNELIERIAEDLQKVRETKPLVHHITNYVVMNETANLTLSLGALPVMAHAHEEVEEMVAMAGALVLNIGTLDPYWIESMLKAGKKANELGTPVVLDPVGAGATRYRTESAKEILDAVKVSVIRGNAAEIATLAGAEAQIKGVESMEPPEGMLENGHRLSSYYGCVVAITGKDDHVIDGSETIIVSNGTPALGGVTGTGCMATTALAVFSAVEKDHLVAAAGALACFGIAGENAAAKTGGHPGSFHATLYDEVARLDATQVKEKVKLVSMTGV